MNSTVTTLPYADYKTEVLDSHLSIPTLTRTVANKLTNERQLSEYAPPVFGIEKTNVMHKVNISQVN